MKTLFCIPRRKFLVLLATGGFAFGGLPAQATMIDVAINTSSLSGTTAQLAFDLVNGDFATNNSVTVKKFDTDGTLGGAENCGGVSGSLPETVTLTDSDFFNELLQTVILGSRICFTLELSENLASGSLFPDQFSLFLLDTDPFSPKPLFSTSDPTGADALLAVDIDGTSNGSLQVYTPTSAPAATWSTAVVPEPAPGFLLAAGVLAWVPVRRAGATKQEDR